MAATLDYSAVFAAMNAADPIFSFLSSGGSWADAVDMEYTAQLSDARSAITERGPLPELLRSEANALLALNQITTEEYRARFPSETAHVSVTEASDLSDTASVVSAYTRRSSDSGSVSVSSRSKGRVSWAPLSSASASSYRRRPAPASRSAPRSALRPTARPAPVLQEAPKKPAFGTQSRFAALMESDSE